MLWEVPESTCGPLKARSGLRTPDIVRKCSVQLRPSHSHEETQDLELWEGPESTWGPPSARCGLRTPDIVRRCWVHLCPSTALSGQDEKVPSPIVALPLQEVDLLPMTLWKGAESTCGPPRPWVASGWKGPESTCGPPRARIGLRTPDVVSGWFCQWICRLTDNFWCHTVSEDLLCLFVPFEPCKMLLMY